MPSAITIALDAMGGDQGPAVVVPGAALSLVRHPQMRFLFVGNEAQIQAELEQHPALAPRSEIIHTDVFVTMEEKPSQALRKGRWKSSMWLAIDAVRAGRAQAVVSAGNTGALMAMAKFCLKTHPEIDRPAIAAVWPTIDSECIVLDVGANVGAEAGELVNFALMGAGMARALFDVELPSVGLLNVGREEIKGLEEIKKAANILRTVDLPIRFEGFVEGDDVGRGTVDVVVTEGFTGNVALKTAEGTAKQIGEYLRAAMNRSLMARLGAVLAQGAFRALKHKMDPRRLNGGIFLGLKGNVIKSHGGTDAVGFASAVDLAYELSRSHIVSRIGDDLAGLDAALSPPDFMTGAPVLRPAVR